MKKMVQTVKKVVTINFHWLIDQYQSIKNRSIAASHSCGTKPPRWRTKVALGQDKQKTYIIWNGNFLCLSCPSATLVLQHRGFLPREWLAAKVLLPTDCLMWKAVETISCIKLNTCLGWSKLYKSDSWFKCPRLQVSLKSLSQCTMFYNAYQSKQIIVIYTLDLVHKKFDDWNRVAPWSKFPCGLLELNSW